MSRGKSLKTVAVVQKEVGLGGTASDGTVALTPADTWVQVPPAGSVPAVDYLIVVSKENADGTIRFSFDNGGAPGTGNGNKMTSNDFIVELRGSEVLYFGSTTNGDDVNYTIKNI
jgi:hypothetical protein